jgi:hypothetical protein
MSDVSGVEFDFLNVSMSEIGVGKVKFVKPNKKQTYCCSMACFFWIAEIIVMVSLSDFDSAINNKAYLDRGF